MALLLNASDCKRIISTYIQYDLIYFAIINNNNKGTNGCANQTRSVPLHRVPLFRYTD